MLASIRSLRVVIASVLWISLVAVPKIIFNMGFSYEPLSFMVQAWWVFVVTLFVFVLIFFKKMLNLRWSLILLILAIIIAYIIAAYY